MICRPLRERSYHYEKPEHDFPPQLPEGRSGRFRCFCHALTGCGGAASSTASSCSSLLSAAASGSTAAAGETFKVGIVNYVDHASLNQIVESVESRLDAIGKEKGVTFDYADYYANAQADQSNLNQIGADLVADGVDVIVAVATPTAATMLLPWRTPTSRWSTPL